MADFQDRILVANELGLAAAASGAPPYFCRWYCVAREVSAGNLIFHGLNHARRDVAFAAYGARDWRFAGPARPPTFAALADVPVLSEAANESPINFGNSSQLSEVFVGERRANAMAHIPSCFVAPKAHVTVNMKGAHALFACKHVTRNPSRSGLFVFSKIVPTK